MSIRTLKRIHPTITMTVVLHMNRAEPICPVQAVAVIATAIATVIRTDLFVCPCILHARTYLYLWYQNV